MPGWLVFAVVCFLLRGVGSLFLGAVPRSMSHDSSEEFEDPEELTPWDHRNGPPPDEADPAAAPRGPPAPAPVNGPMPAAASAPRATPRDAAVEHVWERDHSSGPQPVVILEADGTRRIARVAGPLLPSGRFEGRSESSSSSSTDGEDDDEDDAERHSPATLPDLGRMLRSSHGRRPLLFWRGLVWPTPGRGGGEWPRSLNKIFGGTGGSTAAQNHPGSMDNSAGSCTQQALWCTSQRMGGVRARGHT